VFAIAIFAQSYRFPFQRYRPILHPDPNGDLTVLPRLSGWIFGGRIAEYKKWDKEIDERIGENIPKTIFGYDLGLWDPSC